MFGAVEAKAALGASRRGQQADLLVVADLCERLRDLVEQVPHGGLVSLHRRYRGIDVVLRVRGLEAGAVNSTRTRSELAICGWYAGKVWAEMGEEYVAQLTPGDLLVDDYECALCGEGCCPSDFWSTWSFRPACCYESR